MPAGSATTFTSKPCFAASSIPRNVAVSPAASPSNASQSRFVSRPSSLSCCSVSAVPMRGDDRLEPRLPERDHVGVALDDARAVLAGDRRTRLVEPVHDRPFVEELRLGRVDVFRGERIVVVQLARLEAEHAPLAVGKREQEPALEIVVPALPRQSRRAQLLAGEALLESFPRQRGPAERETEAELTADLLVRGRAL